jgi:hypothetical protein
MIPVALTDAIALATELDRLDVTLADLAADAAADARRVDLRECQADNSGRRTGVR